MIKIATFYSSIRIISVNWCIEQTCKWHLTTLIQKYSKDYGVTYKTYDPLQKQSNIFISISMFKHYGLNYQNLHKF